LRILPEQKPPAVYFFPDLSNDRWCEIFRRLLITSHFLARANVIIPSTSSSLLKGLERLEADGDGRAA